MATSREALKAAGSAGIEAAIHSFMPQLIQRLDAIQLDLRHLDAKIDSLRQEMYDKFEQSRDVMNELGQRIARVEGKLDAFSDSIHRQSDKMDLWLERLVKVEVMQNTRRRRAS